MNTFASGSSARRRRQSDASGWASTRQHGLRVRPGSAQVPCRHPRAGPRRTGNEHAGGRCGAARGPSLPLHHDPHLPKPSAHFLYDSVARLQLRAVHQMDLLHVDSPPKQRSAPPHLLPPPIQLDRVLEVSSDQGNHFVHAFSRQVTATSTGAPPGRRRHASWARPTPRTGRALPSHGTSRTQAPAPGAGRAQAPAPSIQVDTWEKALGNSPARRAFALATASAFSPHPSTASPRAGGTTRAVRLEKLMEHDTDVLASRAVDTRCTLNAERS